MEERPRKRKVSACAAVGRHRPGRTGRSGAGSDGRRKAAQRRDMSTGGHKQVVRGGSGPADPRSRHLQRQSSALRALQQPSPGAEMTRRQPNLGDCRPATEDTQDDRGWSWLPPCGRRGGAGQARAAHCGRVVSGQPSPPPYIPGLTSPRLASPRSRHSGKLLLQDLTSPRS
ncbi:hypothetical protein E2C01_075265 [Portunus trituberculatus]|uniref:Uncharacterized protein n=1 Tax=Portunus trituberculatus TaxID=210409 RepID=A0A5B7IIP4_PORTR|nr:hypothetical protein [Portunus trituberculatus]